MLQWHAAVMACADADVAVCQQRGYIVRVDALEIKRDDAVRVLWRDHFDIFYLFEPLKGVCCQLCNLLFNVFDANILNILYSPCQSCCSCDVLCACLELSWRIVPRRIGVGDHLDHISPDKEGGHLFKELLLAIEDADALWAKHLVA